MMTFLLTVIPPSFLMSDPQKSRIRRGFQPPCRARGAKAAAATENQYLKGRLGDGDEDRKIAENSRLGCRFPSKHREAQRGNVTVDFKAFRH
jgi:hypothetical protein